MAYTNEELSRRKKPSAIKKKKALDAALERLKNRRASRNIREMVSKLKDSDRRTPGPTINIKAKEVKNNQLAKREPDKGSTLSNRGTKNTEVKDKRNPSPYRSGEKKKFKGPSKERIGAIAKGVHSTVKKVGSSVSKAYGDSSWSGPRAG